VQENYGVRVWDGGEVDVGFILVRHFGVWVFWLDECRGWRGGAFVGTFVAAPKRWSYFGKVWVERRWYSGIVEYGSDCGV
jgi:hypothetical protein